MKLLLNLQFFAEGGAGGAATGAAAASVGAEGEADGAGAQDTAVAAPAKSKNPLANIIYGKQAKEEGQAGDHPGDHPGATRHPSGGGECHPSGGDAASERVRGAYNGVTVSDRKAGELPGQETDTVVTQDGLEQRRAEFEQIIKGDFKDLFDERVQRTINARFKETKQMETRLKGVDPLLQALSGKYGVSADDSEALMKAISEDNSYFEDEADSLGLTVEQLKTMRKMQAENDQLRKMMESQQKEEQRVQLFSKLDRESEQCAQAYPGFNFQREASGETGERFMGLLNSGVDVKTAYEVVHKDELLGGAIQYAVAETQKRTVDSIRARGMRPSENGASGNAPAVIVKNDPSKWTKADRDEISRRVQAGERIEL